MKGEYDTIREAGGEVVAVSADGLESHERFAQAMGGCPFPLVCDEELEAARLFDVVGEDGRRSHRAIFVIDGGGTVRYVEYVPEMTSPPNYDAALDAIKRL